MNVEAHGSPFDAQCRMLSVCMHACMKQSSTPLTSCLAALQFGTVGKLGLCLTPATGTAVNGQQAILSAGGCANKFALLENGALQHMSSRLCLRPNEGKIAEGTPLVFSTACDTPFAALPNNAMMHSASLKCLRPQTGNVSPPEGTAVVLSSSCDLPLRFSYGHFPARKFFVLLLYWIVAIERLPALGWSQASLLDAAPTSQVAPLLPTACKPMGATGCTSATTGATACCAAPGFTCVAPGGICMKPPTLAAMPITGVGTTTANGVLTAHVTLAAGAVASTGGGGKPGSACLGSDGMHQLAARVLTALNCSLLLQSYC